MSIRSRRQAKSITENNQIMNNQMFDLSSKLNDQMKSWKPDNTAAVERIQLSINNDRNNFVKQNVKSDLTEEQKQNARKSFQSNLDDMNFNGAFGTARNLGLSEFTWKGKKYTTETKEEQNQKRIKTNSNMGNPDWDERWLYPGRVTPRPKTGYTRRNEIDFEKNRARIREQQDNNIVELLNSERPREKSSVYGYEVWNDAGKYGKIAGNPNGSGYILVRPGAKRNMWNGQYKDEDIIAITNSQKANQGGWSRYVPSKRQGGKFPVFRNGGIIGLI